MKRSFAVLAILPLAGCDSLATTEVSYFVAADAPSERACDMPPSRAAIMETQSIQIYDDIGLLCEFDANRKLVATYAETTADEATHEYKVVDNPVEAKPVRTFGPTGTAAE